MNDHRAILFDLDDTLFDSAGAFKMGLFTTLREHPLTTSFDPQLIYETLQQHRLALWKQVFAGEINFVEYRRHRIGHTLQTLGIDADTLEIDDFNRHFARNYVNAIVPDREVIEIIERLASRYSLGIITNGHAEITHEKVMRLGLSPYFKADHIILSEDRGIPKPDVRIFAEGLAPHGVRPDQTVFVGDSFESDVLGAIHAGMKSVWIRLDGAVPSSNDQPFAIISHLRELEPLL